MVAVTGTNGKSTTCSLVQEFLAPKSFLAGNIGLPLVSEVDDQPTADLLTQRLDVHEKTAWMLRSLLED